VDYDIKEVEGSIRAILSGRSLKGRFSTVLSKVLLYCSNYDPVTKTYRIDYTFVAVVIIQYIFIMATIIYVFRARIGAFFARVSRVFVNRVGYLRHL